MRLLTLLPALLLFAGGAAGCQPGAGGKPGVHAISERRLVDAGRVVLADPLGDVLRCPDQADGIDHRRGDHRHDRLDGGLAVLPGPLLLRRVDHVLVDDVGEVDRVGLDLRPFDLARASLVELHRALSEDHVREAIRATRQDRLHVLQARRLLDRVELRKASDLGIVHRDLRQRLCVDLTHECACRLVRLR